MTDQLSKTFDFPSEEALEDAEQFIIVNIPENATLKDIVSLALDAYRAQMSVVGNIEPKYRHRALEVAQTYLQTAMDAIAEEKDLKLKQEKLEQTAKKDEEPDDAGIFDRNNLLTAIDTEKRLKAN